MNKKNTIIMTILLAVICQCILIAEPDSRYDTGLNLPFNEKAGDVNPQTGNITLSFTDLALPGRAGFHFTYGRIWALNQSNVFNMYWDPENQVNELDSNTLERYNRLGTGWSSTIPYIFEDNSSGELSLFLFLGGSVYQVDTDGINTGEANRSNLLGYDLLDKKIYKNSGIGYGDFTLYPLEELNTQYNTDTHIGTRSEYVLEMKDNSQYWFREDGRLMMRQDRTGLNRIWYFYDYDSRLRLVVDTIGRKIRFLYDGDNNLEKIEWEVRVGRKYDDGTRAWEEETRSVSYTYVSGEEFPIISEFANDDLVIEYEEPFVLETVTDPIGNVTKYDWEEGLTRFTYNSSRDHKTNVYMMLTCITNCYSGEGSYLNKRCFEYQVPADGMHVKYFYSGFMEHYRISRQYYINKLGDVVNDTEYTYYDNGEAGNYNKYSAVVKLGNITTVYTYSMSDNKSKMDVLESLSVETTDGFKQLNRYLYDSKRAKILDEVFRQGTFIYEEKYEYDDKGNLTEAIDKMGLHTVTEYHDKYSLPEYMTRMFTVNGEDYKYEQKQIIDDGIGWVNEERILLDREGTKEWVTTAQYEYDVFGNRISATDAEGNTIYTEYDEEFNAFPVKIYQNVDIAGWSSGGDVHENWLTEPEGKSLVRIRSWKVFNTDGTVWIEIDNEGYAIEHYYDELGTEIETVNPDLDDYTDFAEPYVAGTPNPDDFSDFMQSNETGSFFLSRANNPGIRMVVDYGNEYLRTYADVDKVNNRLKISGKESDGLGNVLFEREYRATGVIDETPDDVPEVYAVKSMEYDSLGRMIALTDPDAGTDGIPIDVHGRTVTRHDKTWIVYYDDLGRTKMVLYPETIPGKTSIKSISYNDAENSVTTIDPERRRIYQRSDWNGNVVEVINYGDARTTPEQVQKYMFEYDPLNRKVRFTDAMGIVTVYGYDERNLFVEQDYGVTGSDIMEYDDLGRLVSKTDRKQNVINFEYDQMGRNTKASHYTTDPETGDLVYSHDVELVYDNRGNAVRISNRNLIEHYVYDYGNRVIKLERRLKDGSLRELVSHRVWSGNADDQVFGFEYTYNDMGMVTDMMYPDGAVHEFSYDEDLSRLKSIWEGADELNVDPFVHQITYNRSGVVTRMGYGNNTFQEWEFDNRKRISGIRITSPSATNPVLADLNYVLNGSGDILSINDNEYGYDGFDRIVSARTFIGDGQDMRKLVVKHFGAYETGGVINNVDYNPEADISPVDEPDGRINGPDHFMAVTRADTADYDDESFEYDRNGNRTRLVQNGDVYTYTYGERNRLERIELLKQGEQVSHVFAEYEYDGNGNTVKRTIYKDNGGNEIIEFEYDTMNRLVRTEVIDQTPSAGITEYLYDNAGNRLIKKRPEGTTVYLRHGQIAVAMDLEMPVDTTEKRGVVNRYVLSGDLLAGRITTTLNADNTVETEKFYYQLDHLNSTKCVTKEDSTLDVMYEYRAFGEQLKRMAEDGSDPGDTAKYSYGGKELDDGTDLYYFNARYYDATIGRFINVDPIQDGTNWYVYCGNNPMCFVDPTGLEVTQDAVISYSHFIENVREWEEKQNFDKDVSIENRLKAFLYAIKSNHAFGPQGGINYCYFVTGNKSGIADTSKLGWHYIHTSEGWIDLGHFSEAAFQRLRHGEFKTKVGGDLIEGLQYISCFILGFERSSKTSAFTREDYKSNRLGAEFGTYVMNLGDDFTSIVDALENFLSNYNPNEFPESVPGFYGLPTSQRELDGRGGIFAYPVNLTIGAYNMYRNGFTGLATVFTHSKPNDD